MIARLARQDGNALVMAVLVSLLVFALGASALQVVDNQQRQSRKQRERENTFQLAEGVLNAQVYLLSSTWPSSNVTAVASECTQASTGAATCPSPSSLSATYETVDFQTGTTWRRTVRDNSGTLADRWTDAAAFAAAPATVWDANADNLLWVRSEAVVRGNKRVLVALVKAEKVPLSVPKATLVADHFVVTNTGNKTMIDTNGESNQWAVSGPVMVRCSAPGSELPVTCANYDIVKQQVAPGGVDFATKPAGLPTEKLDVLYARAVAEGNVYASGCPPRLDGDVAGEVVWIANATTCTYDTNVTYNSAAQSGVVVMLRGTMLLQGGSKFHGLLYHANVDNSAANLIRLSGTSSVFGSIQVAGQGGIEAGSSSVNLVYDPNYLDNIRTFGTAGLLPNSFREISAD